MIFATVAPATTTTTADKVTDKATRRHAGGAEDGPTKEARPQAALLN